MSGTIGLQPIPLYLNYAADESKYADASAQSNPEASSLIAYFQKVAPSIATPAALLGNYKALTVVLGAFGLQDSINNTGILKQLLTPGSEIYKLPGLQAGEREISGVCRGAIGLVDAALLHHLRRLADRPVLQDQPFRTERR